jgi:hypothetical protein
MEKLKINWRQLGWLLLFSIAMGYLETAVVVYLRKIYYPEGFRFPLTMMDPQLVIIELLREAATVVMLAGAGILGGRSPLQRISFFLAAFSIWDLFYYIFLKLLLHWPDSFFTWDILFLIPVPWVGPVLTPCLISLTMLLLAAVLYYRDLQRTEHRIRLLEWVFLILGSLIVIVSWTWDYFRYRPASGSPQETLVLFSNYIPSSYPWWMFAIGEALLLLGIFLFWKRATPQRH